MELNNKAVQKNSKTPVSSIIMYIISGIIGLIGAINIYTVINAFKDAVKQYIAQGYPAAEVNKILVSQQLIPGILEPIGIYFGIAFVLICAGIINNKLSRCLNLLSKDEIVGQTESVEEIEVVDGTESVEETEIITNDEPVETAEEEK